MSWQKKAVTLAESLNTSDTPPSTDTVRADVEALIRLVEDDPDAAETLQTQLRSMFDLPHGSLVWGVMEAGWGARLEAIIEPMTMDRYPILN